MKVAFSLSPGVVASSTIIAAGVMSAFVAPSSQAGIVVENVHRSGRWLVETVAHVTPYLRSEDGFDTTSTFDTGRYDNWKQSYFAGFAGIPVVYTNPPDGHLHYGLAGGYATSVPYHEVMGSYINGETLMYSVGGEANVVDWTGASVRGVLDATFVINGPSEFDFHSWGDGAASVFLWNDSGDVLLGDSGTFAHRGTLGPGRYRVLANYDLENGSSNSDKRGGIWVSIPTPGSLAMMGLGGLLALPRRRGNA
ncbi:MAG: hypothetical protein HEQ23_02860 [Tepidisphaera sp.]